MSNSTSGMYAMLTASEIEVIGEHVFCDDEIGLAWREVSTLPEEIPLNRDNVRNETVLRALSMLEEHDQTSSDDAERAEMYRLEGKLDLALELLSELIRERRGDTGMQVVRFNASGLCWQSSEPLAAGSLLEVDCYVLPPWPLPLKLYVNVVSVELRDESWWVCGRIEGLANAAKEWLGKLVFRRHRRTVALKRHRQ